MKPKNPVAAEIIHQIIVRPLIGTLILGPASLNAADWTGASGADWNVPGNWSGNSVPSGEAATINSIGANIPVISSNLSAIPTDIFVGTAGATGRLDHTAGTASTGAGNWMFVGVRNSGSVGTYNLTGGGAGAGGFTGQNQGSGSMTVGGAGTSGNLYVGGWQGAGTGTLNVNTSGSLVVRGEIVIGREGGTGTFNLDHGSVTSGSASNAPFTVIGLAGTGAMNMSGGSYEAWGNVSIGMKLGTTPLANGTLNHTGGDFTAHGEFWVGQGSGSTGVYNLSAGTLNAGNWMVVGRADATGTLNMTGGTILKTGTGSMIVGTGTSINTVATANVSGGLIDCQSGQLFVGESGTGHAVMNLSASAEIRTSELRIGTSGTGTADVHLNGGSLRTGLIQGGTAVSHAYFNGTQIIASANNDNFIGGLTSASIDAGGFKIDTNNYNLKSSQTFTGSGNLQKSGTGSFSLNGNSTFSGAIQISAGTLFANGFLSNSSGATVEASATIGGYGFVNGLVSVSGTVAPGPAAPPPGLEYLGDTVDSLSASSMTINLGGTYLAELDDPFLNDRLVVTNTLTINGMIKVVLGYAPNVGDFFDLADFGVFAGTPAFDFSAASLPGGLGWDTSSFTADGIISVVTIPEPGAVWTALLCSAGLLTRRRRARIPAPQGEGGELLRGNEAVSIPLGCPTLDWPTGY